MTDVIHPDRCQRATARPLVVLEIASLPAEIDIGNCEAAGRKLLAAFRPRVLVVIADMSATTFCDCSALREFLIANKHAQCAGGELRVVVGSRAVRRIVEVSGAGKVLRLYPDMSTALTGAAI
jgi:anti-sigma B factor antagonist